MRPISPLVRSHALALIAALAAAGLASRSTPLGLAIAAACLAASGLWLRRPGTGTAPVDAVAAAALALLTAGVLPALAFARDPYHALSPSAALPMFAGTAAAVSAWILVRVLSGDGSSSEAPGAPPSPGVVRAARLGLMAYAVLLPVSIAGMQIALGVLAITLAALLLLGVRPGVQSPLDAPIALLAVVCGLSILFSSAPTPPWQTTASFALLSFFVVSRVLALASRGDPDWLADLCMAWALSSAATCVLAFLQHWTGFDLAALLGMRAPIRVAAPSDPGYFAGIGTFNSRLTFAHVTLLPISMLIGLTLLGAAPRRRLILTLCLALGLLGLWSTLARAAWISLAVVLLVAGAVALLGRRARRALPVLLAIVGAALLALALSPGARLRASTALSLHENQDRLFLWARGAELARAHPLLGVGFGSYQRFAGPIYDQYDKAFFMRTWAHDQALSLLAETGPLGLLAYFWILTATLALSLRLLRGRGVASTSTPLSLHWDKGPALRRALSFGGALAATTFFVVGLFHDPLYDGEVAYNLFFALSLMVTGANGV